MADTGGGAPWDVPPGADETTLRNALAAARDAVELRDNQIRTLDSQNETVRLELDNTRRQFESANDQVRVLTARNAELEASTQTVTQRNAQLEFWVRELTTTQTTLNTRVSELTTENERLRAGLGIGPQRTVMRVADLMSNLRNTIQRVNDESLVDATTGKVAYVVEQIDVEARGGLDLKGDVKLVELDPERVGPDTVSTMRFTLRPAVQMRVETDTPAPPSTPGYPPPR